MIHIEAAIYRALCNSAALAKLPQYAGKPAVFARAAPADLADWPGPQYPRCTFSLDWASSPQRIRSGTLRCQILALNESDSPPHSLAAALAAELNNSFITIPGGTYGMRWLRTEQYSLAADSEPECLAYELVFDILGYDTPQLDDPDPVAALLDWLAPHLPGALLIGRDKPPEMFTPTAAAPAVYVRLDSANSAVRTTNSCVWLDTALALHFISPDWQTPALRIANALALEESLTASDHSPIFIRSLRFTPGADPQTSGQLLLTARYGVLREHSASPKLGRVSLRRHLSV